MTGENGLGTSAYGSVTPVLASGLPFHYQGIQHDKGPTGGLELRERDRGSERTQISQKGLLKHAGAAERRAIEIQ